MKKTDVAKLIRQERKALGLNGEAQQKLLRKVREAFGLSNDELAQALGYSLNTLLAYLAPEENAKHRVMPDSDRLVLARILKRRK